MYNTAGIYIRRTNAVDLEKLASVYRISYNSLNVGKKWYDSALKQPYDEMAIEEVQPGTRDLQDQGKTTYDVEGTRVQLGWKAFDPSNSHGEIGGLDPQSVIVHIPGFGFTEQTVEIVSLCQALANSSGKRVYALDTFTEQNFDHSLRIEAAADQKFLMGIGAQEVLITGTSQGASQAIHLATLEQNEMRVPGLILYNAAGLYQQSIGELLRGLMREYIGRTNTLSQFNTPEAKLRDKRFKEEVAAEIKDQIRKSGGIYKYSRRAIQELQEIISANPSTRDIAVPVIIVYGESDNTFQPQRLIPSKTQGGGSYIQDIKEREKFLKKYVFPNSPYVRMLVGSKMGNHSLSSNRPDEVAATSLYLLHRWARMKTTI